MVTDDERDLDRVREPDVQAVVWVPPHPPAWMPEVVGAVERGGVRLPRTVLDDVAADQLAQWLDAHLPDGVLAAPTRAALITDVHALALRTGRLTGSCRFTVRMLTAEPDRRCGFHVDTVMPGNAPWGMVRVYGGAGTLYAEPGTVTRMREFYRYLARRERLVRDIGSAAAPARPAGVLEAELDRLDEEPPFLETGAGPRVAPAGSIVAFTHLDAAHLWSDHDPRLSWIHCSPMGGAPRLVVNVTARRSARAAGASARSGRGRVRGAG